jgi:hypothetical protein
MLLNREYVSFALLRNKDSLTTWDVWVMYNYEKFVMLQKSLNYGQGERIVRMYNKQNYEAIKAGIEYYDCVDGIKNVA